jgi:hypothetical protein
MIKWNYTDRPSSFKQPWTVPATILDIYKSVATDDPRRLSDYIELHDDPMMKIKSGANGVHVLDLEHIALSSYYNMVHQTVHTNPEAARMADLPG